jgi:hypothetical protein
MYLPKGGSMRSRPILAAGLAGALIASLAVAAPARAVTTPVIGQPCDREDLGRRAGIAETAQVTPTITHFKAYYVTDGTTGFQQVQLTHTETIVVTVGANASITASFGNATLGTVGGTVGFSVQKATTTTDTEVRTLQWNFNQPGYYGVYSGTHKVRGTYGSINCTRVGSSLQWVRRPGSEYTTFGRDEEGVVRCEETVPGNSLRRAAQRELGCEGEAARQQAIAGHKAENARSAAVAAGSSDVDGPTTTAAPAGYTCETTNYRITAYNGLVMDVSDTDEGAPITWNGWDDDEGSQYWQVCAGPDTDGVPPVVLQNVGTGTCIQPQRRLVAVEGTEIRHYACEATPKAQKFFIYRDVAGSNSVGIQAAERGAMLGSEITEDGEAVRQYEAGLPDGTGTFELIPIV